MQSGLEGTIREQGTQAKRSTLREMKSKKSSMVYKTIESYTVRVF